MMLKNFAKVYIVLDLLVVIFCLAMSDYLWLLNTQVAFISAMIITIGSFLGYRSNINSRIKNIDTKEQSSMLDERDSIDKIDDPFDLYGEINPQEEFTKEEIKNIIQEEKQKVKQNSFKNTIFSATGFLSLYRILGYAVLIMGFIALNNNNLLNVFAYFGGLLTVSVATLIINAKTKSLVDQ